MPLSRKVRAVVRLMSVLQKLHVLPDGTRAARLPLAKRLAVAPPPWAVGPAPSGVETEDRTLGDLRLRVYRPKHRPDTATGVLYLHGGGFTIGGLVGSDHICARLAADSGAIVVAVEYRLAPEHPYPAALHDAQQVLQWMHDDASALALDPRRLVVAGDSAGGNLAAALALLTREQGPALAAQLLVYPAVDQLRSQPSARDYPGPGLTADDVALCWQLYAGPSPALDPLISPLHAPDLSGLPPALVVTVEYDPLRDEGRLYAEHLAAAGVPTRALHYDDYLHGALSLPLLYDGMDEVWRELADFLRSVAAPVA